MVVLAGLKPGVKFGKKKTTTTIKIINKWRNLVAKIKNLINLIHSIIPRLSLSRSTCDFASCKLATLSNSHSVTLSYISYNIHPKLPITIGEFIDL